MCEANRLRFNDILPNIDALPTPLSTVQLFSALPLFEAAHSPSSIVPTRTRSPLTGYRLCARAAELQEAASSLPDVQAAETI